ncbi:uracil-DNA glycosylase [Euhalothece natronophila Z-M001]|uniref:Type-4 uracil-DNA glycosylase n=1 Tax=Euhalothece natronophila Z-M001 TaxID=522448 RepID=A0A5B8NI03_9CHRO|nr:uracil-DNA glycosylase [Euhalothece natronophila]QDZ38517.1 uracil-DNA glycosylase [Euhalothece natronophila Z-M001]
MSKSDDYQQPSLFSDSTLSSPETRHTEEWENIPFDSKISIPAGTYDNLEALATHCKQCQRCELAQTRTQVVISRGTPQADVMIIGEAPGKSEDEQGLPFVGKSGQLLDKILASVELSLEKDVYISNIVKCRPPENRTPINKEIVACKSYLLEQIRLVDPKIILFTGATALKGLTGEKKGITKIRGQWLQWEGRWAMAIFHPAYLLRNPSREKGKPKWLMWQDMQAVRQKLDHLRASI